jgi:hypothetical protein
VSPLFLTLSLRDLSIGFASIQTVWFERPFRLWQRDLRYAIQVVIVSSNRLALIWLSIGKGVTRASMCLHCLRLSLRDLSIGFESIQTV